MNETQKPKFRFSYLFLLLIAILIIVLIFTNTGYSGERLDNFKDAYELVNGTYVNQTTEKPEKVQAIYYTSDTIYFLVEGSRYEDAFPNYSDYYLNFKSFDGQLERFLEYIEDKEGANIAIIPSVQGVDFWDILYPILYLAFGIFIIWMIFRLINSSNKGAMSFGKSKARSYTNSQVRFSYVSGVD